MDKQEFLNQFTFIKSEYDDGSGFWDSYKGKALWLGGNVRIDIAARSISDELVLLYQKIMSEQKKYDTLWKEFVVNELFDKMKIECDDEAITRQQMIRELKVGELTFGFDEDRLISVWFIQPKSFREHTVLLYGDNDGNPRVAVMEG